MELRGGHDNVYLDLMVHADSTMMDILLFVCKLFGMPLIPATILFLWGLNEKSEVDVEDPNASLDLTSDSTSAITHMRFADVFALMQQVAERMQENLQQKETVDFEHHYAWANIIELQLTLWLWN